MYEDIKIGDFVEFETTKYFKRANPYGFISVTSSSSANKTLFSSNITNFIQEEVVLKKVKGVVVSKGFQSLLIYTEEDSFLRCDCKVKKIVEKHFNENFIRLSNVLIKVYNANIDFKKAITGYWTFNYPLRRFLTNMEILLISKDIVSKQIMGNTVFEKLKTVASSDSRKYLLPKDGIIY